MYNFFERQNSRRKFSDKRCGPEGIRAVRARTRKGQCCGWLLQGWNPSINFLLIQ